MGDWWLMQVWKAADSQSHKDRVQAKVAKHDDDQHEDDEDDEDCEDGDPQKEDDIKDGDVAHIYNQYIQWWSRIFFTWRWQLYWLLNDYYDKDVDKDDDDDDNDNDDNDDNNDDDDDDE